MKSGVHIRAPAVPSKAERSLKPPLVDSGMARSPAPVSARLAPTCPTALSVGLAFTLLGCSDDSPGASTTSQGTDTSETTDDEVGSEATTTETTSDSSETAGETSSDTGPDCDPGMPALLEQEYLSPGEGHQDVTLEACDYHVWWFSAAAGVETTVTVSAADGQTLDVAITYPDEPTFAAPALTSATVFSTGELRFDAPRSGEFAVIVRAQNPGADPELSFSYDIDSACTNSCERETTRFPIVMVHGWTGFENIGPIEYYFNVPSMLGELGYPVVIAVLDPYNSVDVRGPQLADAITASLVGRRARKVNLLGHSQGGIDSRWVAADAGAGLGDRIGALITVATPHRGTPMTDIALGLLPGPSEQILFWVLNFLGATQDQQSDVEASLYTLSETYMQTEFNLTYLDHPGVEYWSWAGETCIASIGCMDAVDPLLLIPYQLILPLAGDNDGLVPIESAKWGEYLGTIPADHIDEVGQIAGLTGLNYDHIAFYRDNARMLKDNEF